MKIITLTQTNHEPQSLISLIGDITGVQEIRIEIAAGISVYLIDDLLKVGMSECRLHVTTEQNSHCLLVMKFLCPRLLWCDGCPHQLPSRCPTIMRTIILDHQGEGASTAVQVRFAGSRGRVLQVTTEQRHHAANTTSNFSLHSVLADGATLSCNTLVAVDKHLAGVIAHQENRNLLLGNHVMAKIVPKLEIQSNGVICSHRSATGRAKLQDVWYCASRGINPDQTMQLLTSAFLR